MPLVKKYDSCDGCGITALVPGVHIQHCSRCRVVQYCSRKCQSRSWKSFHKHECRRPEEALLVSRRTVARFRGSVTLRSNPEIKTTEPDSIYYLKIRRPWINDICLSGPYHVLEATYSNIAHNLRFSTSGMLYLEEAIRDKLMEHIVHIRAPLDKDADKIVIAEIITKQDPELHAALPRPVYNVVWSEPLQPAGAQHDALGYIPLEDMEILGTYLTQDEASLALKSEMKGRVEKLPGCRTIQTEASGLLSGAIVKDGAILQTFQVTYDSGVTGPTEYIPLCDLPTEENQDEELHI